MRARCLRCLGLWENRAAKCPRQIKSNICWQEGGGRGSELFAREGRSELRCVQVGIVLGMGSIDVLVRVVWCSCPQNSSCAERATRSVPDSRG